LHGRSARSKFINGRALVSVALIQASLAEIAAGYFSAPG